MPLEISNRDARRLFLDLQGLTQPRAKSDADGLYDLIYRLGFVQIDSVNAVERAHHMILYSRAENYRRQDLACLLEQRGALFEHWTHDASIIPTEFYPHWRHRFKQAQARLDHPHWRERLGPDSAKLVRAVRKRIEREGPLMARDFEDKGQSQGQWWGWGPSKTALEYLWRTGELAVARREGFQKVYDLTERVIPGAVRLEKPSARETLDWKCRTALERLGLATPREIAEFWASVSPKDAAAWAAAHLKDKDLITVRLAGAGETKPLNLLAFADIEDRIKAAKAPPKKLRFLSPFDPVIRDRARARRLFGFDYRIEIFVPERKRHYGYYVLPILEGDRFTGRADVKVHRKEGRLEVKGLWLETDVTLTAAREEAMRKALGRLARFTGAETVEIASALRRAKAG